MKKDKSLPTIENIAVNFTRVYIDGMTLAFSYQTLIGFYHPLIVGRWITSENTHSTTTGKHLNTLGIKEDRIKRKAFEAIYADVMGGILSDMFYGPDEVNAAVVEQRIKEIIEGTK